MPDIEKVSGRQLRVVMRFLPADITVESLRKQIEPMPTHSEFYVAPADLSQFAYSRAYITFETEEDLYVFRNRFDGYEFSDDAGNTVPAMVEYAPFQAWPAQKKAAVDKKQGTIDNDPEYLRFLEELEQAPQASDTVNPEKCLEEITAREAARAVAEPTVTPLLEHLKRKRDEKDRVREERKKRERERLKERQEARRLAEEQRREAERNKRKEREKRLQEKRQQEQRQREERGKEEVDEKSGKKAEKERSGVAKTKSSTPSASAKRVDSTERTSGDNSLESSQTKQSSEETSKKVRPKSQAEKPSSGSSTNRTNRSGGSSTAGSGDPSVVVRILAKRAYGSRGRGRGSASSVSSKGSDVAGENDGGGGGGGGRKKPAPAGGSASAGSTNESSGKKGADWSSSRPPRMERKSNRSNQPPSGDGDRAALKLPPRMQQTERDSQKETKPSDEGQETGLRQPSRSSGSTGKGPRRYSDRRLAGGGPS